MTTRWLARILIWTVIGAACGFFSFPCWDRLERYPLLCAVVTFPAELLGKAIFRAGLAPPGDAGFGVIVICMGLQWTLLGFLYGVYCGWRAERARKALSVPSAAGDIMGMVRGCPVDPRRAAPSRTSEPGPGPALHPLRRVLRFMAKYKEVPVVIGLVAMAACYCHWQEIVLSQDRDFFLRRVNQQAVAEACLEMLSKPEKERNKQVGLNLALDSTLPEAIRRLEPTAVVTHVHSISITKRSPNSLIFTQSKENPARYDLLYWEGPKCLRPILVYSIYKQANRGPQGRAPGDPRNEP